MSGAGEGGESGACGGGGPQRVQLTPEEKAVLIECRRHSMIRGVVAGTGFCGLVYWFKAQGRVPAFVTRFPGLFYGLGFLAAFVSGANSYRKTCFQKLMNLENSFIADKIREVGDKIKEEKDKNVHTKFHRDGQKPPPSRPAPDVKLEEGPSINLRTYNQDRSMLETRVEDQEQPSAFTGNRGSTPALSNDTTPQDNTTKKRKTFDEIREDNRRRHGQQSHPSPQSPQSPQSQPGGAERKKRNKYGDVVED